MRHSDEDWGGCLRNTNAREGREDIAKARALHTVAHARIAFFSKMPRTITESGFVFEGHYASTIEMIHAACLTRGFHVSNHLCLGFFLRDVLKKPELFRVFDANRQLRNDLVYYGRLPDDGIAQRAIDDLKHLRSEMEKLLAT